jgi:hypothetical protein
LIEVTADLRAGRIRCSMTLEAPSTGRATTRLNWLLRQLRDSKGQVYIEATAVRQRGKGAVRTLAELRETPTLAIDDPARELRACTVSLSANAGTKRGKARGSFITSILETVENFYADVVQHIKPWTSPPVKVRDDEPQLTGIHDVPQQASPADAQTGNIKDLIQTSTPE